MKIAIIDKVKVSKESPKTQLEIQIAELQQQEQQINQQLKHWESKLKKANNLANCLKAADKFALSFLTAAVESENNREQVDKYWLEILISNKVEFNLKFEAGVEAFAKLILESVEAKVKTLSNKLGVIQNQLLHQERKFVRLQARRQGQTLLECKANNGIGCLGAYWCENCQVNYSAASQSEVLKGGAY